MNDRVDLPAADAGMAESPEALRALAAKYRAILAAVPDLIMEVDENRVYTWANEAGTRFFGDDVVGREAAFYFVGEQDTYDAVRPIFDGSEDLVYVESLQRRRDGAQRLLAWWCAPLKDAAGNVTGALSTGRDITDRTRAEHDLRELLKEQTCLHAVSSLVAEPLDSLDETLAAILEALPPGWQYPAITGARITLADRAIATDGFAETDWQLSAEIAAAGTVAGTVDVSYREQRPPADEGPFLAEERRLLNVIARHIGELLDRKRLAERQALHAEVLAVLNRPNEWPALMRDLLVRIKAFTGCDAAGIRLRDGEDYPYYEQNGFPDQFIERERSLCARDERGEIRRDDAGDPLLACMCGAVIRGNTDPAQPFFTEGGSFWTNSTAALMAETTAADRGVVTRNRCSEAGYESVALVPLRSGEETIGLLQINDRRPGRFSPDLIAFFEEIGDSIGVAFTRVQAEEALKDSESKYRALFESSRDAIMTLAPPSWRFTSGNAAAVEMFGARDEIDLVGRPPWEYAPASQPDGRPSDEKAREMIETAMHEGSCFFDWRHRCLGGREFDATVLLTRFAFKGRTFLQATVRDVTERKQAEERLRIMFDAAPDAYYLLDRKGTFIDGNRAAEEMIGYSRDELVGRNFLKAGLLPARQIPRAGAAFAKNLAGRPTGPDEFTLVRNDGTTVPVEIRTHPVTIAGKRVILGIARDITARKRAEEELREHQQQLTTLMSNLPGMAYRCPHKPGWPMDFVSAGSRRLTGFAPSALTGENRVLYGDLIHPDDRQMVWDGVQEAVQKGESFVLEYRIRDKSGDEHWVWEQGQSVGEYSDGCATLEGFISDITDRKRAETAVEKMKRRLSLGLSSSNVGLWDWDVATGKLIVTPEWKQQIGYRDDELAVSYDEWESRIHPDDRESTLRAMRTYLDGDVPEYAVEFRLRHRDGGYRWIYARGEAERDEEGTPVSMLGCHVDITDRKRAEEELRESNEELRNTLDVLERTQQQVVRQERLRSLGEMAGGIAHDFNNALTVIQGFSEMLLASPVMLDDRERARENIERIHLAAQDAAQVVRRMRAFYREDDEHEVRMPADLNKLIDEAVDLTRPKWQEQARADGVTIRIEKDRAEVPPVMLNAAEFREVLTNMIFNAVDAMVEGGTVTLATRPEGDEAVLEIADTGAGMTAETMQRCFDPFYSTKGTEGTGLGLSAAYGVVTRHGGTIDVASTEGAGTTFTIRLPSGAVAPRKKKGKEMRAAGRSLKILLVEDDEDVRELIGATLAEAGHAVETAENGIVGLELFGEGWFDVVITDWAMPEMGGREFAAAVRDIAPSKPIVLLTGFGDILDAADKTPEHVSTVLGKPVAADALLETVDKLAPRE